MQIVTTNEDTTLTSHTDNNKPSIFTNSTTTVFGNLTPVKSNSNGFSFTSFSNPSAPSLTGFQFASSPTTTDTSSIFTFGITSKVSFSDLAKQSSDTKFLADDTEKRGMHQTIIYSLFLIDFID